MTSLLHRMRCSLAALWCMRSRIRSRLLIRRYSGLSARARANDLRFSGIKDDLMTELAKELFGSKDVQKIKAAFKKWFTVVEGIVPTSGFINGLAFPTLADFACVLMVTGQTPYVGAANLCGLKQCGLADYPKYAALVARIKAVPEVAAYLSKSKTMEGNPFGLPIAPKLIYFPFAARGELVRMVAALGGLEITESTEATPDEKAACGSPGALPVLIHGDHRLAQSLAIESYISEIAPK